MRELTPIGLLAQLILLRLTNKRLIEEHDDKNRERTSDDDAREKTPRSEILIVA